MFLFVDPDGAVAYGESHAGAPLAKDRWARQRLSHVQAIVLCTLAVGTMALAIALPILTVQIAVAGAILLTVAHLGLRVVAWIVGQPAVDRPPLRRADEALPVYSIIVPLYREANMIVPLARALSALDYPADKLDVLFAIESDDTEIQQAIIAAELPPWIRTVVVSPGGPRTKPHACDLALGFIKGELIVVYDAEDRPQPSQLRDAVAAFDAHDDRTTCLQARLAPYNRAENALTRLFALDYCQWFDGMLIGLQRLGCPVPLGGTSNHFRATALIEAGGWDPYNVTEDADLGIRLWRLGHTVRSIASTTFEEAPLTLDVWIPQRTRWSRGYLQTFLVHARSPRTLGLPSLGVIGWFFLTAFVGGSILFALVNPIFWAMAAYTLIVGEGPIEWAFGGIIAPLAWSSLIFGNSMAIVMAMLSPLRRGWWSLVAWGLASPIYWAFVSYASYRAVISFVRYPFHWEKTPHGLSQPDDAKPS